MGKNPSPFKLGEFFVAVLLAVTASASTLAVGSAELIAQMPLGERIEQDKSAVSEDEARLKDDQEKAERSEEKTKEYMESTEQWLENAEKEAKAKQSELNTLKSGIKSKASLAKMLNSPGSQLYVINTWLGKETALKQQAETNLRNAQASLAQQQSVVDQDCYHINSDIASLKNDEAVYRNEMDYHADLVRQQENGRYNGHVYGLQHGRVYTQHNQSTYDAGFHQNSNPYWGVRTQSDRFSAP
jgi:hypothetical protein